MVAVSKKTTKYTALGTDGWSVAANRSIVIEQKIAKKEKNDDLIYIWSMMEIGHLFQIFFHLQHGDVL